MTFWNGVSKIAVGPNQQMVRLQSGLSQLLDREGRSVHAAVGALDRFGCLSEQALAAMPEVTALLEKALKDYDAEAALDGPAAPGPTTADLWVRALVASPFLSQHGLELSQRQAGLESAEHDRMRYWRVNCLSLALPTEFGEFTYGTYSREIAHHPLRPIVTSETWRWKGAGDREIVLILWQPSPADPGGPMETVAHWTAHIAGSEVQFHETSRFYGIAKRVLVTYFRFSAPVGQVIFFAEGLNPDEFAAVLTGIELRCNAIDAPVYKAPKPSPPALD